MIETLDFRQMSKFGAERRVVPLSSSKDNSVHSDGSDKGADKSVSSEHLARLDGAIEWLEQVVKSFNFE